MDCFVCELPLVLGYVGPGPGLSMLGALLGLLLTFLAAGSAVLAWPLRAYLRKRREQRHATSPAASDHADSIGG